MKFLETKSITMRRIFIFCLLFLVLPYSTAFGGPVRARNGMVVSASELASEVGVEVLKKGGNAVDAAVATGFALAVVYPQAGNLGGGGFMVIRFPDGKATSIDFREKAPGKAHRDMYLDESKEVVPGLSTLGYLASGVPGSVAGLCYALDKYGTMNLKEILAPAVRLAQEGLTVSYELSKDLREASDELALFPATAEIFLTQGKPLKEGELLVQKDLARTLELISEKGPDAFYKGKIADLIAEDMKKNGGLITREDLANYVPVEREPVYGTYRSYEIISMGPPSSGGIALIELLNILEAYDIDASGFNSSKTIHLMAEAAKRVYADRAQHLGDSDFHPVPISSLTSKQYAAELRKSIDLNLATPSSKITHGQPSHYESHETTHYSVVDKNRMAVSVTFTLNSSFGSKVVIEGAGFLMNNEMDDFSMKPGVPNIYGLIGAEANAIEPGKRMLSSMSPTMLSKDGKLFMVIGTPGGSTIITTVLQIIMNLIDHSMDIEEAIDATRIHHQWLPDTVYIEKRGLPKDVLDNLEKMGHHLKVKKGYSGNAQGITFDPETGILLGASDHRGEGKAVGY
jgi:gamma-glutamyltranspeptidase/glutathione hydrolase